MRRLFRLPHYAAVGSDGDPHGAQALGDDRHGRAAGRVGGVVDQHGLRRRRYRQAGHDLVVESRHFADGRGAQLSGRRRAPVSGHQLPARRSGTGYDPAFAGRLFPGRQGRRPRRLPSDRLRTQFRAGDARPCGRGVRSGIQIPQSGHDSGRRRHRPDDGESGAGAPASAQDHRRDQGRVRSMGRHGQTVGPRAQRGDVAGVAVGEDGDHQPPPARQIQSVGGERGEV